MNNREISIKISDGDYTPRDEIIGLLNSKYKCEFINENTGYGKNTYLRYSLIPKENSCGRKRKLSPTEEAEVKLRHYDNQWTLDELADIYDVSKSTICRILKR